MPKIELTNEFPLSGFDEPFMMAQKSPQEAATVILELLDERYISTVLSMTFHSILKSWQGEEVQHYSKLVHEFPPGGCKQMAYCHGIFLSGDENPDPEFIPDANPSSLVDDFSEMNEETQINVLVNALHIQFGMQVSSGMHPFAIVSQIIKELPEENQEKLVSDILTQYIRQYHSSRQNMN